MSSLVIETVDSSIVLKVGNAMHSHVTYKPYGQVKQAAERLGVCVDWLLAKILDYRRSGASKLTEHEIPAPEPTPLPTPLPPAPHPVYVRGTNEEMELRRVFPDFDSALRYAGHTAPEPLIQWEGTDRICAVDVDYHTIKDHDQRPTQEYLTNRFLALSPAPRYVWVTHGRGYRLIYFATEKYDADDLAAVAACRAKQLEPGATVDLVHITRHPLYPNGKGRTCGPIEIREQTEDVSAIQGWFSGRGDVDPDELDEWLGEHGYQIGQRYAHDKCPIEPHVVSHGDPVVVYENGILCYGCQGHGVRRGTKAPGWFPFEVLLGQPSTSDIARCVESLTHWEHARYILASHYDLSPRILRGAYSTMLKGKYGSDPRVRRAFVAGENIIRFHKRWGTLEGEVFSNQTVRPILENLPACQYVDPADGKVKVNAEKVARFLQTTSLERYGYPHLRMIYGLPLSNIKRYPYEIVLNKCPGEKPQYVPKTQRMSEHDAWAKIQNAFPGHDRSAIELLICAKGCAELDGTWPPFIFIDGPTRSAKTTSVHIAASIAGDRAYSVPCISNDERIRAAIVEAKERGTYCIFNEAVKDGARMKRSKAEAMEFALSLEETSMSHKLYVGPVEMGQLPVFVWTDTYLPQEVKEHAQIARRLIYVPMYSQVDWTRPMVETGMGKAQLLRKPIEGNREYIQAADAILSHLMDRFFSAPITFDQIARALGFGTVADTTDAKRNTSQLQDLYRLWTDAPKNSRGEVTVELMSNSPLTQLWKELAEPPDYSNSQRLQEVDWQQVLGCVDRRVRLKVVSRRTRVLLSWEGDTSGSLLRHRDSEHSELEREGGEVLHLPSLDSFDDVGGQAQRSDLGVDSTHEQGDGSDADRTFYRNGGNGRLEGPRLVAESGEAR